MTQDEIIRAIEALTKLYEALDNSPGLAEKIEAKLESLIGAMML